MYQYTEFDRQFVHFDHRLAGAHERNALLLRPQHGFVNRAHPAASDDADEPVFVADDRARPVGRGTCLGVASVAREALR